MIAVCIILIILLLLLIVIILPHKVRLQLFADDNGFKADFFLLSIFRGSAFSENQGLILKIYIFGIRLMSKSLKRQPGKNNNVLWLKSLDIYDVKIDARYGLDNPFSTGVASGLLSIAASFFSASEINIHPDFLSCKGYLKISASAEIDMGNTLLSFAKNKKNKTRRKSEWIKT